MGFITPGKSLKKRKLTKAKKVSVKSDKLESSSSSSGVKSKNRSTSPEAINVGAYSNEKLVSVKESQLKEQSSYDFSRSILERLPVELIQEVFIYLDNLSALPLVNRHICMSLHYRPHLGFSILKKNYHDLNSGLQDLEGKYSYRYVMNIEILKYKFISLELLAGFPFQIDQFLSCSEIRVETTLRYTKYEMELFKSQLESHRVVMLSADERNNEMAQRAEDDFNRVDITNAETGNGASTENFTDYPERFQTSLNDEKIKLIKWLYTKNFRYKFSCNVLGNLIRQFTALEYLQTILSCSIEPNKLSNVQPLIESFKNIRTFNEMGKGKEQNDQELIANWLITLLDDSQKNDDDLWTFVIEENDIQFFSLLENVGGQPSPNILRMLSSIRKKDI